MLASMSWGRQHSTSLLIVLLLLIPALPSTGATWAPEVNHDYPSSHENGSFEVGTSDLRFQSSESELWVGEIYYPADASAERSDLNNSSAPYPVVVFIPDEDEDTDNYDWFGTTVASAGYIVVTIPAERSTSEWATLMQDIDSMWNKLRYLNATGGQGPDPPNFVGAVDSAHWAIGGHGMGAGQAWIIQDAWGLKASNPVNHSAIPRALYGLGLEITDLPEAGTWDHRCAEPSYSFFLTGSMDNTAPHDDHVVPLLKDWTCGWQFMEVVGGNHIQYEDDPGIFEPLFDGSATISPEQQQGHATEHLQPYFDLVLKADDSKWVAASNRENGASSPSDTDAYVYEDLNTTNLYRFAIPPGSTWNETEDADGWHVNGTMRITDRDSTTTSDANVTCSIDNALNEVAGVHNPKPGTGPWSEIFCDVSTSGVIPGPHRLTYRVSGVNGMPGWTSVEFERGNRAPELISPQPEIMIPQHGSSSVAVDEVAIDPDGTSLEITYAELNGSGASEMSVEWNSTHVTITHTGIPEWVGSATLNLSLIESVGNAPVELNTTLNLTVTPVDDSVAQIAPIPGYSFDEDSGSHTVSVAGYFEDPEGQDFSVIEANATDGIIATANGATVVLDSEPNWSGEGTVSMLVGDGTSAPITATLSVTVIQVDDPPIINSTVFILEEDGSIEVNLGTLVWDEDGEQVNVTLAGGDANVTVAILTSVLRILPLSDWHGSTSGWTLVAESSDGSVSSPIDITVTSVNDVPLVSWSTLNVIEDNMTTVSFDVYDPDGSEPWIAQYQWDMGQWLNSTSECVQNSEADWSCNITVSANNLVAGPHRFAGRLLDGEQLSEEKVLFIDKPTDENPDTSSPEATISDPLLIMAAIAAAALLFCGGVFLLMVMRRNDDSLLTDEELASLDD